MKGTYLGEFEELVLLTTAILNGEAYGVTLGAEIKKQSGRKVSLSSVHTALYRLEKKGYLRSSFTEATQVRGGRRKRVYTLTAAGHHALQEAHTLRNRLWDQIPELKF